MDLKTLVLSLPPAERCAFASSAGTTLGHLRNVMYGYKPCAAELASAIERVSRVRYGDHQTVFRWDLIPGKWHLIWPELIGASGAPHVAISEDLTCP